MKYRSTRGDELVTLDTALRRGLAPDGGLYLPAELPTFDPAGFAAGDVHDTAAVLLAPFFGASALQTELGDVIRETFGFALPLTELPVESGNAFLLELFHGPTAAFKDVGAGFLAACLSRLEGDAAAPLTILVATSGDTGGAVAAAFNDRAGMRVVVLFPEGRVSERQAHQLTCWGDNVLSLAVRGSFDDCQSLVKAAMTDPGAAGGFRFSSANSINIGRLLPQSIYYAHASLVHHRRSGRAPGFIVPTGNLGNALACLMAREMGFPVGPVVLSLNANRVIADYLESGEWSPRPSITTLASAMDVGDPSNMERARNLLGDASSMNRLLRAYPVSDEQIGRQIRKDYARFGFATCPHTATATFVYDRLEPTERAEHDWIMVATAHPAKFESIVEPLIGAEVELPESLRAIMSRPTRSQLLEPRMAAFSTALTSYFSS